MEIFEHVHGGGLEMRERRWKGKWHILSGLFFFFFFPNCETKILGVTFRNTQCSPLIPHCCTSVKVLLNS